MKRIYFVLALVLAFTAAGAQEGSRFSKVDGSVVWQQVYNTPLDSAGVVDALLASGHFDGVMFTKDGFTCRIIPHEVDYRGAGKTRGQVSMYMLLADVEGRAAVQIREGRYRVTVDNIVFTETVSTGLSSIGDKTKLEMYALNGRGEFRNNFWNPGSSPVLDYDIFSMFEIKEKADEEW